ncbi:preprotein translocase subunit SecG [candidate division KSB1 bacterium]
MQSVIIVFHVIVSILLVLVILMQSSKGGGLAGAFGGGGAMGTMFGGRGAATLLSKVTTILALLFMFSCLGQIILSKSMSGGTSVMQEQMQTQQGTTPAANLPGIPGSETQQQATTAQPDTSK